MLALDDSGLQTELRGPDGGRITGRPGSKDNDIDSSGDPVRAVFETFEFDATGRDQTLQARTISRGA